LEIYVSIRAVSVVKEWPTVCAWVPERTADRRVPIREFWKPKFVQRLDNGGILIVQTRLYIKITFIHDISRSNLSSKYAETQ
jgi:hypothetical protein